MALELLQKMSKLQAQEGEMVRHGVWQLDFGNVNITSGLLIIGGYHFNVF